MRGLSAAEKLLQSLGVADPAAIDLEAIAWCCGAEIRYASLESCEARIIGFRDRAIITVDAKHGLARARFSIAHELGHWHHHRGRSSVCRPDDIGGDDHIAGNHRERVADAFAADLLLPHYLFEQEAARHRKSTFAAVDALARQFGASRTATARRLVDYGPEPAILVCHGMNGRRWFKRGPDVPDRWFPKTELDPQSNAFEALHGRVDKPHPFLIGADAWFDNWQARHGEVFEQSVRGGGGEILSLITFKTKGILGE